MAPLTQARRDRLADSDFAIPEKREYPLDTANRARNALVRVSQYGTPSEKARVRRAVKARYPSIKVTVREHGDDVVATDHTGKVGRRLGSSSHSVRVYRKREQGL